MQKVALHNLGCKVNFYETEVMGQKLEKAGYEIVPFTEIADIYVINTCTVTNIADRKSRQMLHKAKKKNPNAIVVAVGCYAQASKEELELDKCVDVIAGNNNKNNIVEIIENYKKGIKQENMVLDLTQPVAYEEMELETVTEHTRAYIKIQDGCNQFCSYCIIPYARGRIRSRSMTSIVSEIERLANKGFKEVVLTGIHLSSYGIENDGDKLLDVIKNVSGVEGIERIRLGSLEPRIITEDFVKTISNIKKVCPHFHLSLQSGCDTVLKRMNRKYTSKEYIEGCKMLRKYFDNPAITTDVIVGFPGETSDEFDITKQFLQDVAFAEMHIFKYSKREGTQAAKMKDQVNDSEKSKRSEQLISLGQESKDVYRKSFVGIKEEVLFEKTENIDGIQFYTGYTKEYVKVAVCSSSDICNEIVEISITGQLNEEIMLAEMLNLY